MLKKVGVSFESEKKERDQLENLNCDLQFKDEKKESGIDLKETPVVGAKNSTTFVMNLLDKLDESGALIFRNENDKVFVKVGGDHGGESFKLALQVANTDNPNSKKNIFVFSSFEAKDSHLNLQAVLSKYAEQIKEPRKAQWRGRRLAVFLFGDYEFLTKMFGISGAAGIHPCLWCNAT